MSHDECKLYQLALPHLQEKEAQALADALTPEWPAERLILLLESSSSDAVKLATVCLSVVGSAKDTPAIAKVLHHRDPVAVYLAEHALWTTWFRAGTPAANRALRDAVQQTSTQQFQPAIDLLSDYIQREPGFAELYNQRAIAWFVRQDFAAAMADCRRTVELNPYHFGALAGLGHCYTQLGDLEQARDAYYEGLRVHPRMAGIRQTLRYVRQAIDARAIKPETP